LSVAVTGGAGDGNINVGAINAVGAKLGSVTIAGDLGHIHAGDGFDAIASLTVRSLGVLGSTNEAPAVLDELRSELFGSVGRLTVNRDVIDTTVSVIGAIDSVFIGRDLNGATLAASSTIGKIRIFGDVKSSNPSAPARIVVNGAPPGRIALDTIVINGDVTNALILAGYDRHGEAQIGSSIGSVIVKGSWTASSIVAGVHDTSGDGFGRGDRIVASVFGLLPSIARIVIQGTAQGTRDLDDFFGITAGKLGKVVINGVSQSLSGAPDDILLDGTNDDFRAVDFYEKP
jgi:hypothetical protein